MQKPPEKDYAPLCALDTPRHSTPLHQIKSPTKIHTGKLKNPTGNIYIYIYIYMSEHKNKTTLLFSKPLVDGFNLFEQILVNMGIFPRDRGETKTYLFQTTT